MIATYLQLFYEFFKTGLFAVGGGAATIPFLYNISDKTGWFTYTDLANMIAISESTPGAIGVNMATYVGFTAAGIPGCVIATLGLVTPSIIVIIIIAGFLEKFQKSTTVQNTFYGLRPASTGLIAAACFGIVKIALLNLEAFQLTGIVTQLFRYKEIILAIVLFILIKKFNKHPIFYIVFSALIGIVFQFS